jgi:hypothetical protein
MDSRNATKHDGHSRIRSDKTLTEALDAFFVTIDWDTFTFTLFDHWVVLRLFLQNDRHGDNWTSWMVVEFMVTVTEAPAERKSSFVPECCSFYYP